MVDLYAISGLPLALDGAQLAWSTDVQLEGSSERTGRELAPFLAPGGDEKPPAVAYRMYRGICSEADADTLNEHGLRYDVTVLAGGVAGRESVKTVGHYHPVRPGTAVAYPEVYEVLCGIATYLLQKPAPAEPGRIEELVAVRVTSGQKLLIPPGYGHVTINSGGVPLAMANAVEKSFASSYGEFETRHGAAAWLTLDEGWVANPAYEVSAVSLAVPKPLPELGLPEGRPLYAGVVAGPQEFAWLVEPQEAAFGGSWEVTERIDIRS